MIIRFISKVGEDIPFVELTEASKRFDKFIHWVIVDKMAGDLASDHYLPQIVTPFPDTNLSLFRRAM